MKLAQWFYKLKLADNAKLSYISIDHISMFGTVPLNQNHRRSRTVSSVCRQEVAPERLEGSSLSFAGFFSR